MPKNIGTDPDSDPEPQHWFLEFLLIFDNTIRIRIRTGTEPIVENY
jgi:hypothetical protein